MHVSGRMVGSVFVSLSFFLTLILFCELIMNVKFKRLMLPALITINGLPVLGSHCFAAFEFGQVALVKPYDTRVAADIVPKRNMLLTVKPESNAKFKEGSLLVYNTEGEIASIKLTPPSDFPPFLDQTITAVDLGKIGNRCLVCRRSLAAGFGEYEFDRHVY